MLKSIAKGLAGLIILNLILVPLMVMAPVTYFVAPFYVIAHSDGGNISSFTIPYMCLGPLVSAFWMLVICHWRTVRRYRIENGTTKGWREAEGGWTHTMAKSIGFMFAGLFGSVLTEVVFAVLAKPWLYPPRHYVAYFMMHRSRCSRL